MFDLLQRNVVRSCLDQGMTPDAIAGAIARVNDLGPDAVCRFGRPFTTCSRRPHR
jgi:hypothetical protein